jgi:hypothetical protein
MLMFEELLDDIHGHSDSTFETMTDYVNRWKDANPIDNWVRSNPILAGSKWHES